MASTRSGSHRRRSRSASNSFTTRRYPDTSLRIATKRPFPIHAFSHASRASTSHKWDVDAWRRGKRRRCDLSPPNVSIEFPHPSGKPHSISTSEFAFSTSSADFNIFPSSPKRRASYSSPRSDGTIMNVPNHLELARLRSNAFWELHRSVAENGEGFVQRMRDYERSRSCQIPDPTRRGRKHPFHPPISQKAITYVPDSDESDNDDDIQIFSGELPSSPSSHSFHHGKRAASMDIVCHNQRKNEDDFPEVRRYSHQSLSTSSPSSDGDCLSLPTNFDPPLSFSLLSLYSTAPFSLPSPVQTHHLDVDECSISLPSLSLSTSASFIDQTLTASDKAVIDLSLALANGAGGINDYGYLENLATFQPMTGGEPGELWH